MSYTFGEGDHVVVRLLPTLGERYGFVTRVRGNGAAEIRLPKGKGYHKESWVLLLPTGLSTLGAFMLIKHVTKAEFEATAGIPNGAKTDGVQRKY